MSTYPIGEAAQRSGFSASALRYYEGIGLVEPATRTDSGYRMYDDQALARLAFIARAKHLGCSLGEITDLAAIWDGDRCGPVQRRFHELVTDKIDGAQRQITELTEFAAQLRTAAEQLSGEPVDGPCDDNCACVAPASSASTSAVVIGAKPVEAPIACALGGDARVSQVADWAIVTSRAIARTATADGGLRLEFADNLEFGELARLVVAEQQCCRFFSFALTVDHRGTGLEVRAPADAAEVVAELFGTPA